MSMIYVEQQDNGFIVKQIDGKVLVVEGRDPKKIGTAILDLCKTPRKSREKKAEVSA